MRAYVVQGPRAILGIITFLIVMILLLIFLLPLFIIGAVIGLLAGGIAYIRRKPKKIPRPSEAIDVKFKIK